MSAQGVEHLGLLATGHDVAQSQRMQRSQQCESLHVKSRRFASRPPCLWLGLNARKNTPPTPLASVLLSASLSSKALKKVTEVEVMLYSFSKQTTWMFSGRRSKMYTFLSPKSISAPGAWGVSTILILIFLLTLSSIFSYITQCPWICLRTPTKINKQNPTKINNKQPYILFNDSLSSGCPIKKRSVQEIQHVHIIFLWD